MIYYVDIDGTICNEVLNDDGSKDYARHIPIFSRIDQVNDLYDQGHRIVYWTARGATSGIDWTELTRKQLFDWNVKHHELRVGDKPHYDVWVDDKANWIFNDRT